MHSEDPAMPIIMLGEKVMLSLWDPIGAGHKLASAFCAQEQQQQQPSPSFKRLRASHLELPLSSYGLADQKVVLLISTFFDEEGHAKVSVIKVLEQMKPILCACVAHAVLKFIMEEAQVQSSPLSLIIPSAAVLPNYLRNSADNGDPGHSIWYGVLNNAVKGKIGGFSRFKELPLTTEIRDDFLASLLHLVNIMEVQALLLLMPINRLSSLDGELAGEEKNRVNEMIFYLGQVLRNDLGLSFLPNFLEFSTPESLELEVLGNGADWRSLYI